MSDDQDEARDILSEEKISHSNPPSGLRNRHIGRAATFADSAPRFARRGSSFLSETLSESRRSFRESTDDLLLPRARTDHDHHLESNNWHSVPLGLALLPALGGLFFNNGSAFVTDISLLGLAALFLNWAVRLPWDWYLSAQAVVRENEPQELSALEDDSDEPESNKHRHDSHEQTKRAQRELRIHESVALVACFAFPALAAWLLHGLRAQLTPRSESLISNYNLTIFLLASEVRPVRHLIKLVQRRTLFLQRRINAIDQHGDVIQNKLHINDITRRLEELEGRVSDTVMIDTNGDPNAPHDADELITRAISQANEETRKALQPEIDALGRAMRRYEKSKMTLAMQVEARLQELDLRIDDMVILAAATQRNANKHRGKYTHTLINWFSALVVVPIESAVHVLTLPQKMLSSLASRLKLQVGFAGQSRSVENKGTRSPQKRKSSKDRGRVVQ